jgi:hypothetical protein
MMLAGGTPPAPLPYTPVEYIVTDGNSYILPGKAATPPRSAEIKVQLADNSKNCSFLGGWMKGSGSDSKMFALARYLNTTKTVAFAYYNVFGASDGMPSVEYSIDNTKPFIVKSSLKKGAQSISVKQENSDSWTTVSKTDNNTVSSTYGLAIFGYYSNAQSTYGAFPPSGSRLYYCKIYDDETYTNLVFDGVPCLYNGEYGLWDKVSDSFKGSADSGHPFSGPSNS